MRSYEFMLVVDPRVPDEEVTTLVDEYQQMLVAGGGQVLKVDHWGRRRLAYPIRKLNEGKYVLVYFSLDGEHNPIPEVERRLNQNDKVLRYLAVRTDRPVAAGEEADAARSDTDETPGETEED